MARHEGEVRIEDLVGRAIEGGVIATVHGISTRDGGGAVIRRDFSRDESVARALAHIATAQEKTTVDTFIAVIFDGLVLKVTEAHVATPIEDDPARLANIRTKVLGGIPEPLRKFLGLE